MLSFENGDNNPARDSFNEHYMPLVEIKDFNALIDNKPLFWSASKKQTKRVQKAHWTAKKRGLYNKNLNKFLISSGLS